MDIAENASTILQPRPRRDSIAVKTPQFCAARVHPTFVSYQSPFFPQDANHPKVILREPSLMQLDQPENETRFVGNEMILLVCPHATLNSS